MCFYALPALPLALLFLPLYVTLPTHYSTDLGLSLTAVGTVLFLARLWDVVTDPLIGILSDRARRRPPSLLSHRKTWMLLGMPLIMVSAAALFLPGQTETGPQLASWQWLFVWSLLLYLGTTTVMLPYAAWGAELSGDYHERSRITGWREALAVLGTLLAVGLPAALLLDRADSLLANGLILWLLLPLTIFLACKFVPDRHRPGAAAVTPTQAPAPAPATTSPLPGRVQLKSLWRNRPFVRLIAAYFLNGVANGLPATLFLLFVEYRLERPDWAGPLLFLYLALGVLGIPLWLKLSQRWGKHRIWCGAMIWAALVFACVPFLGPGDEIWFALICVLTGICLGADLALPPSMQADVIDLDRLQTRQERAGLYFAIWGVATKLALALAVGLAFPLLDLAGFQTVAAQGSTAATPGNTAAALLALALLYSLLPALFKLAAVACMTGYPLNQKTQERVHDLIARRKASLRGAS
ncbi:MAG: MFS transporter [Pseudomonadota bacterium]